MATDASSGARDSVDRILQEWAAQQTDLDFSPVGVVTRLARVRAHLDAGLLAVFQAHGLTAADFAVVVTLRRVGPPYRMAQTTLMGQLALTSGTVSVRLTRLVAKQLVTRTPMPDDARSAVVALTEQGLAMFEQVAPAHLHNEELLLSALTAEEQAQLADLLRRLLVGFEQPRASSPLGFTVAPAHQARQMRVAVGLSDTPGLLVTDVAAGTPAWSAGLLSGDLLVAVGGEPMRSFVGLSEATRASHSGVTMLVLRNEETVEIVIPPARG